MLPGIIPPQRQDQGISQTLQQTGVVPVPGISMEGSERDSRQKSSREDGPSSSSPLKDLLSIIARSLRKQLR